MALLDTLAGELLGAKSVKELGKSAGASETQVKQLVTQALPLFLSGMYQNASTKEGAQSLEAALDAHAPNAEKSTSAMLKKVDVEDGKKIVTHVLGGQEKEVTKSLARSTGLTQPQVSTMLGQLAPVMLSLVGNHKQEESGKEGADSLNLMSILGSALLGGGYQQVQSEKPGGLNLMSLASSLLGGSSGSSDASQSSGKDKDKGKGKDKDKDKDKDKEKEKESGINLSGLLMNLLK